MSNIERLNCFSKLFVIFGLQYFSNYKQPKSYSRRKKPEVAYTIYFILLMIPLSYLLADDIHEIFIQELEEEDEVVNSKSYFNKASEIVIEVGIMATLFAGLIESYFKTNLVKDLLVKLDEISSLCSQEFRHQIDYEVYKKKWIRNFFFFVSIFLTSYGTWVIDSFVSEYSVVPLLIYMLPLFIFCLVIFKFVFFVDLVNFQLENFDIVSSANSINEVSRIAFVNVLHRKTLALRRFYCLIFDSAQLANHISTFSIFFTLIFLVPISINAIFRSFVVFTSGLSFGLFVGEFNWKRKDCDFQHIKI